MAWVLKFTSEQIEGDQMTLLVIEKPIRNATDINNIEPEVFGFNEKRRYAIVKFTNFYEENKRTNVLVVRKSQEFVTEESRYAFSVIHGKIDIWHVLGCVDLAEESYANPHIPVARAVKILNENKLGVFATDRAIANLLKAYLNPDEQRQLNRFVNYRRNKESNKEDASTESALSVFALTLATSTD